MHVGKQTLAKRFTRLSVVLVAAATFFTFVDVPSALASCGDYVMVGGGVHGHDGLPGGDGDAAHSMPGVPICKGPNCQRSLPSPVAPTKGLLRGPHSEMACWLTSHESPRPRRLGEVFESSLLLAEGNSQPLLRPPCL
jgi:hypothetical protein